MKVVIIINFILGMLTILPLKEYIESKSGFMFVHMAPGLMYSFYFVYKLISYIVFTLMVNIIIIYILKKLFKKKSKKLNLIVYWILSIIIFLIPIVLYFKSSNYFNELVVRSTTVF